MTDPPELDPASSEEPAARAPDPWLGRTFADRFRVERRLGAGGMGVVYAARQLAMDRMVALKVLTPELSQAKAGRVRFHREMKAASRVEHANTVRVFDFGEAEGGQLFLAMELLDGRTLQQELHARGALDLHRVIGIGEAIARALGAAHAEGVVHRDLKPENVMLIDRYGERDQVKVLDFGMARLLDDAAGEESVTRTGSLLGTPLYMSPEAALGHKVDAKADLYALGLVLYQMATGQLPFRDAQPLRLLYMHANQPPQPPSELAPGRVPAALEALILTCLAKDPGARPADAAAVARQLRAISESATWHEDSAAPVGESRLAGDAAALAAARGLRADPQRAVATVRDSTPTSADDGGAVEVMAPTWSGALVQAGVLTGLGADALTAPTLFAASPQVASPADSALTLDDDGDTFIVPHGPGSTSSQTPPVSRSAPAAELATAHDGAVRGGALRDEAAPDSTAAVRSTDPSPQRRDAPAMPAALDTSPAMETIASKGRLGSLLVVGLAVLGLGVWLVSSRGAPAPTPAASTASASASPVQDAASSPLLLDRGALDAALQAAGLPALATDCAAPAAEEAARLTRAAQLLRGAHAQSRRAADSEAAALLATAKSGDAIAVQAFALLAAGRGHVEVIHRANDALAACPSLALAERVRGQVHLQGGRWEIAAAALRQAIGRAPGDAAAHHLLGVSLLGLRDPVAARLAFAEALRLAPSHLEARVGLGRACFASKDFACGRAALAAAAAVAPERKDLPFLRGGLEEAAGDADAARKAYCRAAELGHPAAARRCPQLEPAAIGSPPSLAHPGPSGGAPTPGTSPPAP